MHNDGSDYKAGIVRVVNRASTRAWTGQREQRLFACSLTGVAHTVKIVGIGVIGLGLAGGQYNERLLQNAGA